MALDRGRRCTREQGMLRRARAPSTAFECRSFCSDPRSSRLEASRRLRCSSAAAAGRGPARAGVPS